jgi:hypothetical protein
MPNKNLGGVRVRDVVMFKCIVVVGDSKAALSFAFRRMDVVFGRIDKRPTREVVVPTINTATRKHTKR